METTMKRSFFIVAPVVIFAILILSIGCNKERIVESTEYVYDTKYVESPPDTVFSIDTVFQSDSVIIHDGDTVYRIDTVIQVNQIHDTVLTTIVVHDTIRTTVVVYDTVETIRYHYDTVTVTVTVTDTVTKTSYAPSGPTAIVAMQYYTDEILYEYMYDNYDLEDGWIFYLSSYQLYISQASTNVYDIYAYVEYWSSDWYDYYAFEIYWRLTYKSGDPSNPSNWTMSEPPSAVSGHQPGIKAVPKPADFQQLK